MKKLLISLLIGIILFSAIPSYALTTKEINPYVGKIVDIQLYTRTFLFYTLYETKGKILEVYEDELLGTIVKLVIVNIVNEKAEIEIQAELITYVSDGKTSVGEIVEE